MKSFRDFLTEEEKVAKSTADYQDSPKGQQRCDKCTMWRPPAGCTAVRGKIAADGWCKYYEKKNG
jgi:hypothetical protein